MARQTKRKSVGQNETQYHCIDCEHSYDWHSKAIDGHLILCRCPFKQQGGKYCVFLSDPQCERFKKRETNAKEE